MAERFHVTGASGSGTSTLGRALAEAIGGRHLDTDDYFWFPTDPPCQEIRPIEERLPLLEADADPGGRWALSGSLCGWGDPLIPRFEKVILLSAPTPLRLERLRRRELKRFGAAVLAEGGSHHEGHAGFMAWAALYDEGGLEVRSRTLHETWLEELSCPVLQLDGTLPLTELLALALA
jgi:adenylate kinase family enzyme